MAIARINLVCLILSLIPYLAEAQNGNRAFRFVEIPSFARLTATGGYLVSQPGEDINLVMTNPGQSTDSLNGMFSASYLDYIADVAKVQFAYQHGFGKAGSWFVAVDHIGYGEMDGYDDSGQPTGEYKSGETLALIGTSHQVGLFRLGASVKFISSSIAGFNGNALALDLGGTFRHPEKDLAIGLVFQNIGTVLSDFDEGIDSDMPFNVQAGVSFKPEFMPLRFHFTMFNLTDWESRPGEGEDGAVEKAFSHLNIGAELLLHKHIDVRLGYNYGRRQDLRIENAGGGAGFSYGIRFKSRSFSFAYSRGGYHVAGGANNFTLILNTEVVFRKGIEL
ncbi:MAG: type IX secretion system protein PorQ [Cyclobacteriaceae bacterium]